LTPAEGKEPIDLIYCHRSSTAIATLISGTRFTELPPATPYISSNGNAGLFAAEKLSAFRVKPGAMPHFTSANGTPSLMAPPVMVKETEFSAAE
jgi:hypothetical protein